MIPPLIRVEWDDAHGTANEDIDTESLPLYHSPLRMISWGLLLKEDETGVTLVTEQYGDRQTYRANKFIPRSLVRGMWVISRNPLRGRKLARAEAPVSPGPLLVETVEAPS